MPAVEEYGVEPIPEELRTVGWRDLFAITFTFFLNPVMYVLGALAVVDGGLPLWWAVAAMVLGQALAFGLLVVIAQPGVDYGLPGQVALRATLGFWGARLLSSPYRMIAATYWFAAQALAGALGIQAIVVALGGGKPSLVPVALALAVFHATLAVLGFDVMRFVLRVVLPVSLAFTGVLLALYFASDDPRYAVGRVFESPDQHLTWAGFATYVTVMCGASLTLVTNVADLCRYTRTRRDMRIGLFASAVLAVGGDHVRRRIRGGRDRRAESVHRRRRPDEHRRAARAAARRDRRAGHRCEHHQRLHGGSLARERRAPARPPARDAARRGGGDRALRVPRLHRAGADLDRAPGQRRRAADRRHPRRLPRSSSGRAWIRRRSSTPAAPTAT